MIRGKRSLYIGLGTMAALAAAQGAWADTVQVTISGATLFRNFFLNPASTNDFIDVDNDGLSKFNATNPAVEQLAPVATILGNGSSISYATSTSQVTRNPVWDINYRELGSVNGLQELLNSQSGMANPWIPLAQVSKAYVNTTTIINGGVPTYSSSDPSSGYPTAVPTTGADIAVLDVPSKWGLNVPGASTAWNTRPTQPGYGYNPLISNVAYSNKLVDRTTNGVTFDNNTSAPTAHTLFDTPVAIAPINVVANPGVGTDQIKATQLQQLFVTGRLPTGENLVAVLRSVGSGTHNGMQNSLGVDPSYGVGENTGANATGLSVTSLGATFQPGNLDGSGDVENELANVRLGIGEDGSDRATGQSGNKWGSMKVMNDQLGGTQYVTSSVTSIVNNSDVNTGWRIGGLETFVTVGDPNATAVNANFPARGKDGKNPVSASNPANPAMAKADAAKYLRNITESIGAYNGAPTSDQNLFMPADYLSAGFVLQSGAQLVQSPTDATVWIPNPDFNQGVHDQALLNGTFNAKLVSDASVGAGVAPLRSASATPYSDGSTTGAYRYFDNTGASFDAPGNSALNMRNNIAGDFSGDGKRNVGDIPQLMAAVADPTAWAKANHSGAAGAGLGNAAIPEVLGDFNGDGNFDSGDVRYFADGLAIATSGPHAGQLDRKAGFIAVDTNWSTSTTGHPAGNYFNTTKVTAAAYHAGDSRGDVAGSIAGPQAGAAPTGADGVINVKDIDYVLKQMHAAMGNGTDGSFATLLTRAITDPTVNPRADLSADINGDLAITFADAQELVEGILGVPYGDANLNGVVDIQDQSLVTNNWQSTTNSSYSNGDLNGDGIVDIQDLTLITNNWQRTSGSLALAPSFSSAAVPEPASLALLASATLPLLLKRRRK